jgi:glycerol-3-phosphate dehydrogenase (NAD(P)+)
MKRIAVIGAGSWGTALSVVAGRAGHRVVLWSRNEEVVDNINRRHVNDRYLKSCIVPDKVRATTKLGDALQDAELVLLASPSHATRGLLERMFSDLQPKMIFVSATKGIEAESGKRISEVVNETAGKSFDPRFVCLSGPSFAQEVVAGQPTAIVAASVNSEDSQLVQKELSFDNLRIYTNSDVIGTEIGGAVKNVMAIAAGMVAGLGLGSNSVAAMITRGLAEIGRLALAVGARHETLMGLAGLGDLVLTCTGGLSRNRHVGVELGKGRKLHEITEEMHEVAEGVLTTLAVKQIAERLSVEMPITNEVNAVLYKGRSAAEAASALMTRPLRGEFSS